ncbi:LIM domain-containing protein WLIM2b [Trifolium repens]|nr:LIM domain-containing protein WLIM2b [Trifolium repens]WJX53915.1 LIM domain-containing protein WLIM2b [Trifolium repens]
MSFSGTQQKCKSCDKTVHLVDSISADGNVYHKNCFRCSQCNGLLAMSTYSSMEGVLYCKTHAEQVAKESGSFAAKRSLSAGRPSELPRAPSKLSAFFSGTQEKCSACKKTVYPLEKLTVEGEFYHKSCFRCTHGGCFLSPSSYAALDGFIYCKPHFSQLFKAKGSYSYLSKQASMKKSEEMQQAAEQKTDDSAAEPAPAADDTETKEEQDPAVETQEA